MELVQSRIVTDDVARLAGFYARMLGVPVTLNDYYVEVQAGPASVGFSRRRFTEYRDDDRQDEVVLDFLVDDVDAEYPRIAALGVEWVLLPATQPWGNRSMIFRDPAGHLVNVFSRRPAADLPDARCRPRVRGVPVVDRGEAAERGGGG
jgi:catechol 2,3-dioxygenase-like lactoylglutathione lyase family enzyme